MKMQGNGESKKTKTRFHHPMRERGFTGYRTSNINRIFFAPVSSNFQNSFLKAA
jgi:hypothetical protein